MNSGRRQSQSHVDPGKGSALVKCDRMPQEGLGQRKDVAVTRVSLTSMQKSVLVEGRILEAGRRHCIGRGYIAVAAKTLNRKNFFQVHISPLLKIRAVSVPDKTTLKLHFL